MRVFISYSTADLPAAASLAAALRGHGVDPFLAPWALRAGAFWLPELGRALHETDAFLLLLGPSGPGSWQLLEYCEALDRKAQEPAFPLIPVLLPNANPSLPFLRQLHWHKAPTSSSSDSLAALLRALNGKQESPPAEPWRDTNPYRGLSALLESDCDVFFGRERLTTSVIEQIRDGIRFVVLVGSSGVGKSSVQRAGVVASLRRQRWPAAGTRAWPQELAGSRRWAFLSAVPHPRPVEVLVKAFLSDCSALDDPPTDEAIDTWATRLIEERTLAPLVDHCLERYPKAFDTPPPDRFVIVLDQMEELYRSGQAALGFSSILAAAAGRPDIVVLASLRSDRYGEFQSDVALFSQAARVDVPPFANVESLAAVVEGPARLLNVAFAPTSTPRDIAQRVAREPGALPLLSYILEEMWGRMQRRGDGRLLWSDYEELGGASRVLGDRFEDYLATCTEPLQRAALQRLFTLRLAQVERDRQPSRRRAKETECTKAEWAHVEPLASSKWRLLVVARSEGEATAEVAHEIVLAAEGPVREWLADDHQFLEWKARLEDERRFWERAGRADSHLLQGAKLQAFTAKLAGRLGELSAGDAAFLEASRQRELEDDERRRLDRRMAERGARTSARFRRFAWTAVALAIGTVSGYLTIIRSDWFNIWMTKREGAAIATENTEWVLATALVRDERARIEAGLRQFNADGLAGVIARVPPVLRALGRTDDARAIVDLTLAVHAPNPGGLIYSAAAEIARIGDAEGAIQLAASLPVFQRLVLLTTLATELAEQPHRQRDATLLLRAAKALADGPFDPPWILPYEAWRKMIIAAGALSDDDAVRKAAPRFELANLGGVLNSDELTAWQRTMMARALLAEFGKLSSTNTAAERLATLGAGLARAGFDNEATRVLNEAARAFRNERANRSLNSFNRNAVARQAALGWAALGKFSRAAAWFKELANDYERSVTNRGCALELARRGDASVATELLKASPPADTDEFLRQILEERNATAKRQYLLPLLRRWTELGLPVGRHAIAIGRTLEELGDRETAGRLLRKHAFDRTGLLQYASSSEISVVARVDATLARQLLDAELARLRALAPDDSQRPMRLAWLAETGKGLALLGDAPTAKGLLHEARQGASSLQTNERWKILGVVAEGYAAAHRYFDARSVADQCDPVTRLTAYAAILRYYAAEQDPRVLVATEVR